MASCKLCRNLTQAVNSAQLAIDFEPWELTQSEKSSGCQACALILAGIRRFQNPSWHFEDDVARVYLYGASTSRDTLSAEIYYKDDRPKLILEFYHLNDKSDIKGLWEAIRARKPTNGHPLERDAIAWVKLNLEMCEQGHFSCSPITNSPLPFRILHLKAVGEDILEVKLVEDKSGGATGRYATLSHRWGDHQLCITTMSSIRDRWCGIPWQTIPKTFQDAMIYCLKLGIEYLWIDALCIVQDSPRDWQRQSAQMARIYQNSYITLSATTAMNDSAGCFSISPSDPSQSNQSLLSQNPPIYVREKLRHWTNPVGGSLMERFPLLTRGWVFQERILSKRSLHFCDQELVWECAENTVCECGGVLANASIKQQFAISSGHTTAICNYEDEEPVADQECDKNSSRWLREPRNERANQYQSKLEEDTDVELKEWLSLRVRGDGSQVLPLRPPTIQAHSRDRSNRATNPAANMSANRDMDWLRFEYLVVPQTDSRDLEIWHKIVEQYSSLELTRISDRLPALSGLAERIAPGSRPYLAGLWKDTIRLDLLWRVDRINEVHGRISGTSSPTWSWSSVSSGVKYWTREELKQNIFYTQLDVRDEQAFGKVGISKIEEYREWQRRQKLLQMGLHQSHDHLDNNRLARRWQANRAMLDQLSSELLDWCLLERSFSSIPSISHKIEHIGVNPFGEVEEGVLKVKGFVRRAILSYVRKPGWGRRIEDWKFDHTRYQLDFTTSVETGTGMAHDVSIDHDVSLDFYADYDLSNPRTEQHIRNREAVYLLEVLVNLFLVLRLRESRDPACIYQRIGIFRAPLAFERSYGKDFMIQGKMTEVLLI